MATGEIATWQYNVGINEPTPKNPPKFSSAPTGMEVEVDQESTTETSLVLPTASDPEGDTITLTMGPCSFCTLSGSSPSWIIDIAASKDHIGSHSITLQLKDSTGQEGSSITITIKVISANADSGDGLVSGNEDGTIFIDWAAFDAIIEVGVF